MKRLDDLCVDCVKAGQPRPTDRVRWCADGFVRCTNHRLAWLEHQGVGKPAAPPPAIYGRQASFL